MEPSFPNELTKEQKRLFTMAKLNMLRRLPYYGVYAVGLHYSINWTIPTAATNGTGIKYNPAFLLGGHDGEPLRDVQEVIFIIAHEVLHCSFKHMLRMSWREHQLWNIAADYAINWILHKGGVGKFPVAKPDPKTGKVPPKLLDTKYDGMTAEQIYDLLEKQCDGGAGGKIKLHGVVVDLSGDGDPGGTGGFEMPENLDGSALTDAQRSELERTIDGNTSTAAMSAKSQGKFPADLERLIDTALKPKVNWRERLRHFVARQFPDDYSWRKPHRRYLGAMGLYLPFIEKTGVGKILTIFDTSGSIGFEGEQSEGALIFAEIKGIAEDCVPEELHVMYCDARVAGHDIFGQGETPSLKPRGGGGTDFRPPFAKVNKEGLDFQCVIYLTDGYGPFPEKPMPYPVLWVMTTDVVAPWGETIKLER